MIVRCPKEMAKRVDMCTQWLFTREYVPDKKLIIIVQDVENCNVISSVKVKSYLIQFVSIQTFTFSLYWGTMTGAMGSQPPQSSSCKEPFGLSMYVKRTNLEGMGRATGAVTRGGHRPRLVLMMNDELAKRGGGGDFSSG